MIHDHYEGMTQELHLVGNYFKGRLQSIFGFYYNDNSVWKRPAVGWPGSSRSRTRAPIPGRSAGPPGVGGPPAR